MLEETAIVVDARDGYLWVESQSRSACGQCSSSTCTTSVVAKLFGVRVNRLRLLNSIDARPGQEVIIGIPDALLVRASLWAYMVPLIGMVAGALAGVTLGLSEGLQSGLALIGLGLGFYGVHRVTRGQKSGRRFTPLLLGLAGDHSVRVDMKRLTRSRQ